MFVEKLDAFSGVLMRTLELGSPIMDILKVLSNGN
jgi:hypothetical protein